MKNNNIILITFYDLDSFAVHTLHAVLKRAGFNVYSIFFKSLNINSTVNPPTDSEISCLIQLIKKLGPFIVGISFRSTFFELACRITEEIKKNLDTLIVWGGIHPTIRPEQCVELTDVVCVGEGEGAIVDLAERLFAGEKIDGIRNLWIKKEDETIKNDPRPLIQDIDSLPFPDFSNENKYFINGPKTTSLLSLAQRTGYSIMTSRGCPFHCTYCYNSIAQKIYKNKGSYVRRRSVHDVIEEIVQAKRNLKNLSYISFLDDLFTFNIDWIKEFHDRYKKDVNLPFYCHIHPRFADEEMISLLKDAGCAGITMGIQTGSEESRHKYFERYENNNEIINSARILHKHKIECTYDLIMDNPLETDIDKGETFNLLLELPKPFELCIHSLTYFPETKLTKLLLEKGIIAEEDVEDKKRKAYDKWVPALDLDRDRENLFWDNLYYLTQKKRIPKKFIIWLSKLAFLKANPKPLTFLLRLNSFSIYTIRNGSKLDKTRWFLLTLLNKPYLLFKKRSWVFVWMKLKTKVSFIK